MIETRRQHMSGVSLATRDARVPGRVVHVEDDDFLITSDVPLEDMAFADVLTETRLGALGVYLLPADAVVVFKAKPTTPSSVAEFINDYSPDYLTPIVVHVVPRRPIALSQSNEEDDEGECTDDESEGEDGDDEAGEDELYVDEADGILPCEM